MIDRASIEQILAQYKKHGWQLRRVLLSASLSEQLGDNSAGLFGDALIIPSETDAAWFSRSSQPGLTAWEIRNLSVTPFAQVVVLKDDLDASSVEAALNDAEARMAEALSSRKASNGT